MNCLEDIGEAVARSFRRQGYIVYGLVRREEHAKVLRKFEVTPVLGYVVVCAHARRRALTSPHRLHIVMCSNACNNRDALQPATWKQYVEKAQIIIDATDLPDPHDQVARAVFDIVEKLPIDPLFPPKTFMYLSLPSL